MPPRARSHRNPDTALIEAYAHPLASRVNIPTIETASMLTPDQIAPVPIPEPDADAPQTFPTLNWIRSPLPDHARTYGPLYLHESVVPEELVKSLLQEPTSRQGELGFAAVNGFTEEDGTLVDNPRMKPYQYENGHWTNRLIRGTAQRAMASLLYKDNLRGKVNLIYLDPPYNIGFRSNFQLDIMDTETQEDARGVPYDNLTVNAYRDNYRNGVHSYLDGLLDQLELARDLLAEDGSIIVQMSPENVHQVAVMMGEVFGTANHAATIPYRTTTSPHTRMLPEIGNWLIWFTKNKAQAKYFQLYDPASNRQDIISLWGSAARYELPDGTRGSLSRRQRDGSAPIPEDAKLYRTYPCHSATGGGNTQRTEPFVFHPDDQPCLFNTEWTDHVCAEQCHRPDNDCPKGKPCNPQCNATAYPCPANSSWRISRSGLHKLGVDGRLELGNQGGVGWRQYEDEVPGRSLNAMWYNAGIVLDKQYIVETPPSVMDRCVLMTTAPGDLVLDLSCGSGAMPVACERWGRRWIAIDVSAVSIAIARERIATTIYPYHILQDSPEGHQLEHQLNQWMLPENERSDLEPKPTYGHDPARGFVNERQTRVSAATLAYGPRTDGSDIIRHQDRTQKDNLRYRVATPFTVESDSPYRSVNPTQAAPPEQNIDVAATMSRYGFSLPDDNPVIRRMTESMEVSGIKNPGFFQFKVENLQPAPVRDITHTGLLIGVDQKRLPAYFYIAAEDEVVSATKTYAAALAAGRDPSIQHLVMVSFGRDEDVHQINHQFPAVTILQVQAHRDLQLATLKPGLNDDAFTVISEPEVRLHRQPNGQVRLEVIGLNAFDPVKGTVSPSNTSNVAGIVTDTAYDGQSFKVRLINIQKRRQNQRTLRILNAVLRNRISPDRWSHMTSNTTVSFDLPMTEQEAENYARHNPSQPRPGTKVAVKVIDRTGMEHMTVLDDPRSPQWY